MEICKYSMKELTNHDRQARPAARSLINISKTQVNPSLMACTQKAVLIEGCELNRSNSVNM